MSTYAIGDLQGCFDPLMRLLEKMAFEPKQDTLWFTGDLVNRGPQSLATLRFVKSLGRNAITVLGNHDLGMLAIARGAQPFDESLYTFGDILQAPDKEELLDWLEQQPLLHHDTTLGYLLVHAGLYPWWDLTNAKKLAKEVEDLLKAKENLAFYQQLYGNSPERWDNNLQGYDRLRFIVNAFTRMRFCSLDGKLDLVTKESTEHKLKDYYPWFEILAKKNNTNLTENKDVEIVDLPKILFGHWASLRGKCPIPDIYALDTGCVWGNALTALRLEDGKHFNVSCASS